MVKKGANHELMFIVALVLLAVGGYYLYKRREIDENNKKRIDTASVVPDARGPGHENADAFAMYGAPQRV
jgi:LPXTG-motif cell wall-anchored protein